MKKLLFFISLFFVTATFTVLSRSSGRMWTLVPNKLAEMLGLVERGNQFIVSSLPGHVEAESYDSMQGLQLETTSDVGGGQNISSIDDGDWLDYSVSVPQDGVYSFKFRVANGWGDGAKLELRKADGTVLTFLDIPRTGGLQSWQTFGATAHLTAGSQMLRLYVVKGNWNLNWFEVSASQSLPGKIEAESFDVASDVRPETTSDDGGGQNLGYIDDGDWMDYNVSVASAGEYVFQFRVANSYGNGVIYIKAEDGTTLGSVSVPRTYGWQNWTTISTTATLPAGSQVLRIYTNPGTWNFNWFSVTQNGSALPGHVEAEDYTAMQGMQQETTSDVGGGQNINSIDDGDWLDYNVAVASSGIYSFKFRVANGWGDGAKFELRKTDGTVLTSVDVPRTGGLQNWQTLGATAHLTAGSQKLRLYVVKGNWNLNWFEAATSRSLPGKIEAESFDMASDVRPETTSDDGGGQNLAYIDDGDWMDYNVSVASAGVYTFQFRVANSYGNGIIYIKSEDGNTLGSVSVPRTYGWQNWTTVSTTATLPAGGQVLRIYTNPGAFNFNWFTVTQGGAVLSPAVITFGALPNKTVGDADFNLVATTNNTEVPVTFTSSNPSVIAVSNTSGAWKASVVGAGSSVITASQAASASYLAATNVAQTQTVTSSTVTSSTVVTANQKIPIDAKRWYQLNNVSNGLDGLFDGITDVNVETGWGKVLPRYDAYYPLLEGESMTIASLKFYDFTGDFTSNPMTLSIITDQWERIQIATFTGDQYGGWVGPYPDRSTSGDARFKLDQPITNARYLVINTYGAFPTEMELYGSYTPSGQTFTPALAKSVKLKDMLGVNAYEWNFEDGNTPWQINESKMNVVKSFSGIRHYMDWNKLEANEGDYSYNPTLSGGWNFDAIYERCKAEGIEVLACLKTIPDWMANTYPQDQRDGENVPLRYGKDFSDPLSYLEQAKAGFQYMARYGSNTNVNPALVSVNTTPRWTGDNPNTVKIGLGLIKYIECDNERDKWWKGRKAYQTAREYAANLSAFYDGHKNTMGPGVGVKNADPSVKVVIGGLASASSGSDYVKGMIDWCKQYRGYKPDGTVNLCWDIINYHMYSDNTSSSQSGTSTRGAAPEVTPIDRIADDFRQTAHRQSYDMPVWITEAGYDVNQGSPIRAIPIGAKSALETQGDWILRTALLYARKGIEKLFFYQLYDDNGTGGMFGTSGLANGDDVSRRPAADYLYQTKKLFGEYSYKETTHSNPIVDRYEKDGKSAYVLVVPDEIGRTALYTLDLGTATQAQIYRPKVGSNDMELQTVSTDQGKLLLTVTETPMFVVAGTVAPNARIAATTPTEGKSLAESVRVFPNPTASYVSIQAERVSDTPLEVTLFDAGLGRLHQTTKISKTGNAFSEKIDLSQLAGGVYILEIKQDGERVLQKVLKVN
ncbi:carbohydrate-binding protein [Spirosoma sp. KCTC 42546]|uniref:carbohydrate-binding protein n=1 Tax=Spirosoma sp. KCTC 42546 TaxID=2520506 RepID=UPI00115AF6A0|nr:carbohydrate-binding protein [Spirosoma sp. KCTC 42546]QDK79723.1 carbohydrate-binding protein [Spirosoma sp. KCTC 42546]